MSKEKITAIFELIGKLVAWVAGNILFGLLPLFLLIIEKLLFNLPVDKNKVINDGIVMFFCTAILGGVSIDILFVNFWQLSKRLNFLFVSIIIASWVFWIYASIDLGKDKVNYGLINWIQKIFILFTSVYVLGLKSVIFSNEKR